MTNGRCRWLAAFLALALALAVQAQTPDGAAPRTVDSVRQAPREKVVTNALMASVGHTDILDTYLSPEKFTGTEARFLSHTVRSTPGKKVSREVVHQVIASVGNTRGDGGTLLGALYNLQYGWHYNLAFPAQGLRLRLGGLIDGVVGGVYDTNNGNNPAQARISLALTPSAAVTWDFHISGRPFRLGYEVGLPLAGLAFSPQYGQSYYEIFSRGNYDHNIVFTSLHNAPQLHQLLTFDFRLWRSVFRVGYLGDIRQMKANNLKYHQYTHAVVLGWVRHFSVSPIHSSSQSL
jgi:hypothetical protein